MPQFTWKQRSTKYLLFQSSSCLRELSPSRRWERTAGALRPHFKWDGAAPQHAPRERGEPPAELENREAAPRGQGAAEPDVHHRSRLAGDPRGAGQSQGHRLQPATGLSLHHRGRQRLNAADGSDDCESVSHTSRLLFLLHSFHQRCENSHLSRSRSVLKKKRFRSAGHFMHLLHV